MLMDYVQKPKNWRLACQTVVGKPDSRGMVISLLCVLYFYDLESADCYQ